MKPHFEFLHRMNGDRTTVRDLNARFRRARRLYVAFCCDSILTDPTNATINLVAKRMIEFGLYPPSKCERSARHGILSAMYRFEEKRGTFKPARSGWKWHEYMAYRGFQAFTGQRSSVKLG